MLVLAALVLATFSGIPGLFCSRLSRTGERLFVALITLACLGASFGAVASLARGWSQELALPWSVPGGCFVLRVDAIAAVFVLQISALAALCAWYGLAYWPQSAHPCDGRKLRTFYGVVTGGMLLLVIARNAILFLAGWELMALAAFLLVSTEDEKPVVREVGYLYLLATRAGTLCLLTLFALLGGVSGTLDFSGWPKALSSPFGNAIFVLGLCGFGIKAGVMPLHVWLPGAHANAPSHVSALLSGVLIKTGIYGLVRLTSLAHTPPLWWGSILIVVGAVSGVLGVGFAIGQHDLKRLLAYHSVENIGIICMGLGVAVLGRALGRPDLVALGVAGALLHVWNHGLFKSLLFLSAGSVLHATATRDMDRLGGLLRLMPRTGLAFLIGSVAICGLPPLNGLISELFVYLGLFRCAMEGGTIMIAGFLATTALALIGALALACFAKAFCVVFLGLPRTDDGGHAQEAGPLMLLPMAILAGACLFVGIAAPLIAEVLDSAVASWVGPEGSPAPALGHLAPLGWISATSAVLLALLVLFSSQLARAARRSAFPGQPGTWDCGYAAPSSRMQYTSSSFAGMLLGLLGWALRPHRQTPRLTGPFPESARFHSHLPDTILDRALRPLFSLIGNGLARLRPIQIGSVHLYLLYIFAALLSLLLWR